MRSRRTNTALGLLALPALTALLAGCAAPAAVEREPAAAEPPGYGPLDPDSYLCGTERIPSEAIAQPTRVDDLDAAGRAAIADAVVTGDAPFELDDPSSWAVIDQTEDRLVLIRPGSEGGRGDHDLIELSLWEWPGEAEPRWTLNRSGGCLLTVDLGELGVAEVALDPASPPVPESRELHLMVLDPQCGGAVDMPGRIEVARVEETDDEVRLLIGTRPLPDGGYTCEGFPPSPFALELDAPLGEREIVDASRVLERVLRSPGDLDAS